MINDGKNLMAYLAGIFDGDGSFSLIKENRKEAYSPLYYPLIQLANISKTLIDFLMNEIGGSYTVRKSYRSLDGSIRKTCYQWKVSRSFCLPVLEGLLPYLVLKKDQARTLLDFILDNRPYFGGGQKVPDEVAKYRESIYFKMRKLNDYRDKTGKLSSKKRKPTTNNNIFWAYIAGLIDTDGSFSVKKETKNGRKSPSYTPIILLSMVDHKSINYLYENCAIGRFFIVKSRAAIQGFCYRFGIYSKSETIEFLNRIIPFLIVKKEQASALLEFCMNMNVVLHRQAGIPETELQIREELYQKIKQLNQYGVFKSSLIDLKT